jgi:Ca-activated chloride channel family protein
MKRLALACAAAALMHASPALAWEWFRSESSAVERGNQLLHEKKFDEAVQAYDEARASAPDDPGIQLDRGTALLGAKKHGPAREALRSASRGHVDPEVRGRALHNLGLSFFDEADELAKAENLDEAQARLRESVDAYKAALRAKPGFADAAWNLDLARRRLVDVEKKREEKKREEQDKEKDKEDQDKQDQGKQPPSDDAQDPDAGGEKEPSEPEAGDGGAQHDADDHPGDAGAPPPADKGDAGAASQAGDQRDAGQAAAGEAADGGAPDAPPRDAMERALDALRDSEENLQKQRAQARARQEPRRILKDW